jgi:hypothetical protein
MDAEPVLAHLSATRSSLTNLTAPPAPGVYAFFLRPGAALPGVRAATDGFVYVGLSSDLAQREFGTHFQPGQSGFSTLRRSLGALLIDELDLQPLPRGAGLSDTNFRNYRFDGPGEQRLSTWMYENLEVAVHAVPDPRLLERTLIESAGPPLNLTLWSNPDAAMIKAARKSCVEAARCARR